MDEKKHELIANYQDTQRFLRENSRLAAAVEHGKRRTRFYSADSRPELPGEADRAGVITLWAARAFEAAMALHRDKPEARIAVHNFASAVRPGSGVKSGGSAQEESLCRCSTLYPTLDQKFLWDAYYTPNREAKDVRHTDACIYSPGVIICKTDTDNPERLDPKEFVRVDVVTCAAPNLNRQPSSWHNPETGKAIRMEPEELFRLHVQRGKHLLRVCADNGADIVVLGAFGCGGFANNPEIVARAYRAILEQDRFRYCFDQIVFAIYCRDTYAENYYTFEDELETFL